MSVVEADKLVEQAHKGMKSFFSFGTSKFEAAAEKLVRAGNIFKANKYMERAADVYVEAAEAYLRCSSAHDASQAYFSAGGCLKKLDAVKSADLIQLGVAQLLVGGSFSMAAKHLQEAGELLAEAGPEHADRACEVLEQAAGYYEGENSPSRSNTCNMRVAAIKAKAGDYEAASRLYMQVGKTSIENNLLRYGAKDQFFLGILCAMAMGDAVRARDILDEARDLDSAFATTRESALCGAILEAWDAFDVDAFTEAVADYDRITAIDPLKTTILLKVRSFIETDGGASLM